MLFKVKLFESLFTIKMPFLFRFSKILINYNSIINNIFLFSNFFIFSFFILILIS